MKLALGAGGSLLGGALAAVGASACCVGPLLLVTLGFGGAWLASLRALEPLFPVFVLLAVAFFGMAFWKLYRTEQACAPDQACAVPRVKRWQRWLFWILLVTAAAIVTFPWYSPYLFG